MPVSYTDLTNNGSPLVTAINSFLQAQPQVQNKPKAALNYMLVDEQFKYVDNINNIKQSGSIAVGAAGQLTTLANNNLSIQKNGYMYIWVSNETQNWDVFFDNLSIKHTTGPLLEETHYYPFGLTMAAISTKAFGKLENKFKFNGGSELNNSLDINQYETPHRGYDQQLGMFHQIDPLSSLNFSQSPYNFCDNNPIRFCDPLGLSKRGAGFPDDKKADESVQPVVVIGHRKDNKLTFYQADALALDAMSRGIKWDKVDLSRYGPHDREMLHYMFSSERARARQIDHDWHEAEGDVAEFIGWTLAGEGIGFVIGKMANGLKLWRASRIADATIIKAEVEAEKTVFNVTREGVALPKGSKIPNEFIENPYRSSSYGLMENGKFVEKVRIDPATPLGFKGPNFSHYHLNGNGKHLTGNWPWH